MLTLQNLNAYLNELLQVSTIPDFCPNGLQIEGTAQISAIATAVTASLETIREAVKAQVQVLIVHHGLFWSGDSYAIIGSKREKISLLLNHGISLLAYHLPLDMHTTVGNNWKAAQDMGWSELQPFGLLKGIPMGVQGKIRRQSRDHFRKMLEEYYQHPAYCAMGGKQEIETVALISGGAHKSIDEAISAKVDCFITGSFDEPIWHKAYEDGMNFYALGHSATERVGPIALSDHLHKKFGLPCNFIDIPNPF